MGGVVFGWHSRLLMPHELRYAGRTVADRNANWPAKRTQRLGTLALGGRTIVAVYSPPEATLRLSHYIPRRSADTLDVAVAKSFVRRRTCVDARFWDLGDIVQKRAGGPRHVTCA